MEHHAPVFQAARVGNLGKLMRLRDEGVAFNNTDDQGFTPLYYATAAGHHECMKYLMQNGATWIPLISVGKTKWNNPNGNILDQAMGFTTEKIKTSRARLQVRTRIADMMRYRYKRQNDWKTTPRTRRDDYIAAKAAAAAVPVAPSVRATVLHWGDSHGARDEITALGPLGLKHEEEEDEEPEEWEQEYTLSNETTPMALLAVEKAFLRFLEEEMADWDLMEDCKVKGASTATTVAAVSADQATTLIVPQPAPAVADEEEFPALLGAPVTTHNEVKALPQNKNNTTTTKAAEETKEEVASGEWCLLDEEGEVEDVVNGEYKVPKQLLPYTPAPLTVSFARVLQQAERNSDWVTTAV